MVVSLGVADRSVCTVFVWGTVGFMSFGAALGCGAEPGDTALIEQQQQELFGNVLNNAVGPQVSASTQVTITNGGDVLGNAGSPGSDPYSRALLLRRAAV